MPATINLTTIPGVIEQHERYSTQSIQLFGPSLGRETIAVANVAAIGAAVQAFGQRVRAMHPDASFRVSISMRKGDRKPRGYDAGYRANGFGQEDFLHVIDRRAKPAAGQPKADVAITQAAAEMGCEP